MKIIFTGLYPVIRHTTLFKRKEKKVEKIENLEKTNN